MHLKNRLLGINIHILIQLCFVKTPRKLSKHLDNRSQENVIQAIYIQAKNYIPFYLPRHCPVF